MTVDQILIVALITGFMALQVWGRWRYDLIAFATLLVATICGLVPAGEMFSGLGHPATVTVALVLILSRGLRNSGAVNLMTRRVLPPLRFTSGHVAQVSLVAGSLSAFMNNVGALALLMPAVLEACRKVGRSPAVILMPLSFAAILGGLVTLIGTPPNIIVATFRAEAVGEPFRMFDFAPVGGMVALAGIMFVALVGWHLIPQSRSESGTADDLFRIEDFVTEARVPADSPAVGKSLGELEEILNEHDARILALIRKDRRVDRRGGEARVQVRDILLIEAGSEGLDQALTTLALKPVTATQKKGRGLLLGEQLAVMEGVVAANAPVVGRTSTSLRLKARFNAELLAVSRQGQPFHGRLKNFQFRPGDVLLLQGDPELLPEALASLGCLPLADRDQTVGGGAQVTAASLAIFAAAVAVAAVGLVPITVAFGVAAVALVVLGVIRPTEVYEAVDWPVIILLAAMIPIGGALETTGTTTLIAQSLVSGAANLSPVVVLAALMVLTMTLSDVLNNAATTVIMAPIALAVADQLGVNPDALLMAVAIGGSCAFLTPIGHQNNALILGPGGYRFGDFWRMGLPLEILIVVVAIPMLLWVWPLHP